MSTEMLVVFFISCWAAPLGSDHIVDPPKAGALLGNNSQWDKFVVRVTDPSGGIMGNLKPAEHVLAYKHAHERYAHSLTYKSAYFVAENLRDLLSGEEDTFSVLAIDKIFEGVAEASEDGTVTFPQATLADAVAVGLEPERAKAALALLSTEVQDLQQTCRQVMQAHGDEGGKIAIGGYRERRKEPTVLHCDWYGACGDSDSANGGGGGGCGIGDADGWGLAFQHSNR